MTLHWWMHWFWITYQICVCFCDLATLPMQSLPSELHETTKIPNLNRSVKAVGSTSYIPPITAASANGYPNATAVIPIKLHKPSKKHDLYANLTNKSSVTTEHPLVKETTVIDQNVTDSGLNITDNQTFVNPSFNAINRAENLSYINDDNSMNQTIIVNSERVGAENNESTKGSLSAAGITGITLGCVSIIGVICAVSFIMYRNYGFNRPQVLNDRCSNPDSSGYIDDSTVRENSEEMYSLDNDSFLNSLEAMTIQNLWTDTVKHTKL